jgi:soluble lytic murein transglycosylase-like protein
MLFILSLSSAYADDKTDERAKKDEFVGLNKTLKTYVEEASQRFLIPSSWIWAVMKIESAGDISALSEKGAMGLMQIMPETWQMLRQQYNLGSDPFSPRDNILAGAGYLRYLHERYGNPGVFAAYNAGPGRYEDYLKGRKLLPLETIDYTSKVNQWASLEMAQGGLGTIVEHNMATHSDIFN